LNKIENNNLIKVGLIVDNIDDAAKTFSELFGIPTPEIILPPETFSPDPTGETYTLYQGELVAARTKICNLQMGSVTVELLEPLDEPSPFTDFKEQHGQGIQYITFTVNGFEQHIDFVESKQLPLIHKGEYGAGRYCFFDSVKQLGIQLGLQELGPKKVANS
jgi:methylmalonyl-CoA/ethylmalonyl-CoA epimerase